MLCHCIPCHAMPHTIQHTIPYYRIPHTTYQMPDTSYHILIPYPYPQHVMPYYVLSYRIKPYIDILSRNTHNRYINTYIQIIGILAQANVDERCGSLRHSWLVCHTPYLKMFLQHSYQYLWRVMKSSCTWSKLQKYISFTLSRWDIHSGFLIIYQWEKGWKVPIFDQVWPITAEEILKNDAPRGVRKPQVVTDPHTQVIMKADDYDTHLIA